MNHKIKITKKLIFKKVILSISKHWEEYDTVNFMLDFKSNKNAFIHKWELNRINSN